MSCKLTWISNLLMPLTHPKFEECTCSFKQSPGMHECTKIVTRYQASWSYQSGIFQKIAQNQRLISKNFVKLILVLLDM